MSDERWSGGVGFILATMGSAIGLGSVWKFPYEAGANGGGGFVLAYLLGLGLIVGPLVIAEFAIGRGGRGDAIQSIANLAHGVRRSGLWRLVGALGVLTGFLILSFYSVIGGWALSHATDALLLKPLPGDAAAAQADFARLLASPGRMIAFHVVFMAATALVVAAGVEGGIERASRLLMPLLFFLVFALAIFSLVTGDSEAALRFLFGLDLAHMSPRAFLDAVGLGFFSIGVGLGSMITYAAYARDDTDLVKVAVITVAGDTLVSFLSGLAIFPIVFRFGLDPASGPGLMFITLPLAFGRMPGGEFIGFVFYLLLLVSALVSAISLLELATAPLIGRGLPRPLAAGACGIACALLGAPTVLSFNLWREGRFFERLDALTSDIMLPLAGVGLAIFAGWVMPKDWFASELRLSGPAVNILRALLRYIAPPLIAATVALGWA